MIKFCLGLAAGMVPIWSSAPYSIEKYRTLTSRLGSRSLESGIRGHSLSRLDLGSDLDAVVAPCQLEVVGALQVDPEFRRRAEKPTQT
jgi:hypothetical protein